MESSKFEFKKFQAEDFPEYQSWFADENLNEWLGPMKINDEWLDAVLDMKNEKEYAVFRNNELVGVVGITFLDKEHPDCHITDFAVKPDLTNQGIGSTILHELMKLHPNESWKIYIDQKNSNAISFFKKNGWSNESGTPDTDGMIEMRFNG